MKKLVSLLLVLLSFALCAAFAEAPVTVYVSVSDASGALVLAYAPVTVTDTDADGVLTIGDALCAAHIAHFPAGAEGYGAAMTEYGLSLTTLWGSEPGSSFGYFLNDQSAWSLADPVADGDHVKAYVYTDLTGWSDAYCWFGAPAMEAAAGAEVALTLTAAGYDAQWNPIALPVEGAVLTISGEATSAVTDAEGRAVLTFAQTGTYVVSAVSPTQRLVAPVCVITVTDGE